MAVSTRLKNNAGLYFALKKGTGTATAFDDVKAVELSNEPKDDKDLTFAEAASGVGADWTVKITAISSFDTTSLNSFLWDNAGQEVTVYVGVAGNATPSTAKPHFVGTAKIPGKPGFSNEAGTDGTGAEFEMELAGTSDFTKVTA